MRGRQRRGYSLMELMTVVALFSIMVGLAIFAMARGRGNNDINAFARAISNRVTIARRRAVSTGQPFLVDVRAKSVAYCQRATSGQTTCPSPPGVESDRPFVASDEAIVSYYALDTDIGQGPAKIAIGTGASLLMLPSGSADSVPGTTLPEGMTFYLEGTVDTTKQRRVSIYSLAGRPRMIDRW
jgi:prepilin-type N-terminal cleavage/methylation domain-containing protein